MTYFPQLASGAVAQFPWRKVLRYRVIRNESTNGSEVELDDLPFEERRWELPLSELSDSEWQTLADLHAAVQGSRFGFTFLEPGANLLSWSEDFSQDVWEKAGGLTLTSGLADPFGGSSAWRLSAGSAVSALQRMAAPAACRYVGSAWIKTGAAGVELRLSDGVTSSTTSFAADGAWHVGEVGWPGGSAQEEVSLEIFAPAGASIEVYGAQVEAQVARSAYKRTGLRGGVYANARFAEDRLKQRFAAPNSHSTTVRIVWTPSSI